METHDVCAFAQFTQLENGTRQMSDSNLCHDATRKPRPNGDPLISPEVNAHSIQQIGEWRHQSLELTVPSHLNALPTQF